jgi:hypothetical protein
MAFINDHPIYDALPISNDILDKGGVELLRAAVVDQELFVTARLDAFVRPYPWGFVLADIARRLASLYAADDQLTEAEATTAIADEFARSLRMLGAGTARYPSPHTRAGSESSKPAQSARSRPKTPVQSRAKSKPSTKAMARRKGARPKH